MKKIKLLYKNKNIQLELKEMNGFFNKAIGLMFCRREKAKALLFSFKNPVALTFHSFFVFFDFIAIWLDKDNKIISVKKIKPWSSRVRIGPKFTKVIEIPINNKYGEIIKLLDGD